jgi:uncharacterized glyoxalase superfamily protein PhnB
MPTTASTIIPSARYRDAHAAIEWLCRIFGFTRQAVYEGPDNTVAHAQLTLGGGMFMLGSASNGGETAGRMIDLDQTGGRETLGLCIISPETEAIYARAKEAGAEIVQELSSPEYGGKAFACRDLEGRIWWIGSYDPWQQNSQEPNA